MHDSSGDVRVQESQVRPTCTVAVDSTHEDREHMNRYHSIHVKCPFCKLEWKNDVPLLPYGEAFRAHLPTCQRRVAADNRPLPEALSERQVQVLVQSNFRGKDGDAAWTELYRLLFPEEQQLPPSPCRSN